MRGVKIVSDVQRYKICQQFTTVTFTGQQISKLFQTCKDTKFVSNSQRSIIITLMQGYCFRRAKIQNLSAIHNMVLRRLLKICIVSDVQRYKICQQFTTKNRAALYPLQLFQTCKDTKFVSNSQPYLPKSVNVPHCFRRAKIQNLSAIHNDGSIYCVKPIIVSDVQRYKICQQFTTFSRIHAAIQ